MTYGPTLSHRPPDTVTRPHHWTIFPENPVQILLR